MPKESLHHHYGRLSRFLKGVAIRLQLLTALEFLLLLASGFVLVLLGSLFALVVKDTFSYLPFIYCLFAIAFLGFLLLLGLWKVVSRPSLERVARGLEEKFPQLRDDVTNSLLLFDQIERDSNFGQVSEGLIAAQLRKTAGEVDSIKPQQVVSLKRALRHLRVLLPLLFAFLAVLAMDPHFLGRSLALIIHPFSSLPIKETFISVEPGGPIVLRGTPVVIRARATGTVPEKLFLTVWPEGRDATDLSMDSESDGRFIYRTAPVQASFRYQAHNGRAHSPSSS